MKLKLKIKRGLSILIVLLAMNSVYAQQDPMFTQYMFNTQTINPAYAGTWDAMGFMVLARQQWVGWEGAPKTYTLSFQTPMRNENVAFGLNAVSDVIGLEKRLSVFGDYSYKLRINDNTRLRLGLKGGFTNYSHNLSDYTLYPDGVSDPRFQGEVEVQFMPNVGVGTYLHNERYYVGLSIPKLIHNGFDDNYNNFSIQAEVRHFFLMAGMVFDLNEYVKFKPTFLTKATLGAPLSFDLTANFLLAEKVWLGAMIRPQDSFGFIAQWIFDRKLRLGYAVDFTTSDLRNYHGGTHEIMVSYEVKFTKKRYVSPRYF